MQMLYTDLSKADDVFIEDDRGTPIKVDERELLEMTKSTYVGREVTAISIVEQFSSFNEEMHVNEDGDDYARCATIIVHFANGDTEHAQWNCYF